jgi:hypothetical protein
MRLSEEKEFWHCFTAKWNRMSWRMHWPIFWLLPLSYPFIAQANTMSALFRSVRQLQAPDGYLRSDESDPFAAQCGFYL